MPIFRIVVVCPAIKGKAPQTPQPIDPKKKNFKYSFFIILIFFFNTWKLNSKRIMKTTSHLQKANDIGGTYSTPPLATIKLLAINIGWINSNKKGSTLLFLILINLEFMLNFYCQRMFRKSSFLLSKP